MPCDLEHVTSCRAEGWALPKASQIHTVCLQGQGPEWPEGIGTPWWGRRARPPRAHKPGRRGQRCEEVGVLT